MKTDVITINTEQLKIERWNRNLANARQRGEERRAEEEAKEDRKKELIRLCSRPGLTS